MLTGPNAAGKDPNCLLDYFKIIVESRSVIEPQTSFVFSGGNPTDQTKVIN